MTDTREPELSLERLEVLVEAYGGNIDRFPARDRARAKALVMRSPDARRLLDAARGLDALLEAVRESTPSLELESALSRIPSVHVQERRRFALLPFPTRGAAWLAAAAALALGVLSGGALGDGELAESPESIDEAEVAAVAFADDLYGELEFDDFQQEGGQQ
jgi:hypothetical protein